MVDLYISFLYALRIAWPPITMATQHPDNASAPFWRPSDPFISTQDEIDELLLLFKDFPIDEYMWDWEGKYVDEAVGEKLFSRAADFFGKHPLGSDLHLTYRIPALEGGRMHRLARAFMNVLSLADFADDIGLARPPVTEMFLPLTTAASQPLAVLTAFRDVAQYHKSVFHQTHAPKHDLLSMISVTPLVEDTDSMFEIEHIVRMYWKELQGQKDLSGGQRIFLARSDPALNAGLVPAVLAVKSALSTVTEVGESLGFPVFPILGTGSLPFRGSVNPTYLDTFLNQYAGTRTYSIQSAFRYDYPELEVQDALQKMKTEVPKYSVVRLSKEEHADVQKLASLFSQFWRPTIEVLAPLINTVAAHVPPRRERLQHIGLFGYSRGLGQVKLPRAIGFTAALYSIGIPPELIATGRGLAAAEREGMLPLLARFYPALRADLQHAGKYFNRENLELLASRESVFKDIQEDVASIERILQMELGPQKPRHMIHRNLTSTILHRLDQNESLSHDIVEAGKIRRSLG